MTSLAMLAPARYLADFARFVTKKGTQERHDAQALSELEQRPLTLAPGLELRWLGVSGYSMTFYHEGSANLIEDALRAKGVDVFLAGVAGRGFTRDYWQRILTRLEPRTIVPTHYDDFFRPLGGAMGFTTNVNLAHVPDEVRAVSAEFEVSALPLLEARSG
jgi:L-ascorbate metabolism protein UlaG (beta-lactamase superfamily)